MTLARYTGPRRAYIGAIGTAVPGGVEMAGRVVVGQSVAPLYSVTADSAELCTRSTWDDGCIALAHAAGCEVPRDAPSPAGLERVAGDVIYRLEVT